MCHQHTVTNLLLLPEFTITGLKASIPSPGTCLLLAGLLVCQAPAAYRHLLVTPVSYIIYYGMHSVHAILASSKNRDLGTRVWAPGFGCCLRVAWVFLPGASCPPDAPPKNQPDTDAPHGSVHRVVVPNDPLYPDASFPSDAPPKQSTRHVPLGFATLSFIMDRGTLFPADTLSDSKAFTGQKNALSVWDMML